MKTKTNPLQPFGGYHFRKKIAPWCILLLPMAFTVWLRFYPILRAFIISLYRYDPVNPPGEFVGLANYSSLLSMQSYLEAWTNTFIFLILQFCLTFLVPLVQALFLNELRKLKNCLTTIYILPALVPTSINVIIWKWVWNPDYGIANQILEFFGGTAQTWLSDPDLVKFCIVFPGILGGGLTVLLYLSAIQGIPSEILEAAALDGCTGFRKIFHIILPNISFLIFIQMIMTVIGTMQALDGPYLFTAGGPGGASTTQGIFIYNSMQKDLNYGRSAAAAIILMLVIVVLTQIQMHFEKAEKN